MDTIVNPNITGEFYRPSDAVKIMNHIQANDYLSQGVLMLERGGNSNESIL